MKTMKLVRAILAGGALIITLWGCGNSNSSAPSFLNGHPAGWDTVASHGLQNIANPNHCTECHGSELLGGISKVSCSTECHVHKVPAGYNDWATAHGEMAKAAPGIVQDGVISGFVYCQYCHGALNTGTILSSTPNTPPVSCMDGTTGCHTPMLVYNEIPPHSGLWNWRSNGFFFNLFSHTNVHEGNASACIHCHNRVQSKHYWYYQTGFTPEPDVKPIFQFYSTPGMLTPAPAGTPAGCFNNTLCHGEIRR